jgi:hypothetical protein
MSSPGMTAALAGAVLALAATNAWAGPCTSDIADFEAAIARSQGNPLAGLTAPQSVGAQLEHQPTPASVKAAQARLKKTFAATMARARQRPGLHPRTHRGQADVYSVTEWAVNARSFSNEPRTVSRREAELRRRPRSPLALPRQPLVERGKIDHHALMGAAADLL